jgi:LPS-assembly lipoprotein
MSAARIWFSRRVLSRWLALALLASPLHGCGFKPVGADAMPFSSVYVAVGDYASFGAELRRYLERYSKTRLADTPGDADAVIEILSETQQQQVLSINSAGRVQEYLLRYQVAYRVRNRSGNELVPASTIQLERDLTYDDNAALGKENESAFLYRNMKLDAVDQLVRRLSLVNPAAVASS